MIPIPPSTTHSHLSTLTDPDILNGPLTGSTATSSSGPDILDHPHNLHALGHLPEDDMLAIQKRGWRTSDEELATVGIGPGVGHGQQTGGGVLVRERLVRKRRVVVDGGRPRAVRVEEIAALRHEVLDLWKNETARAPDVRQIYRLQIKGWNEW